MGPVLPMEVAALLATFRLTTTARCHFSGLRQASARLRKKLPAGLRKKLVNVDIASAVVRHLTPVYLRGLLDEVEASCKEVAKSTDPSPVGTGRTVQCSDGQSAVKRSAVATLEEGHCVNVVGTVQGLT